MVGRTATRSRRLGADDWVRAGFEILAEEGLGALKLEQLCARLGMTKGSFYWHFADMESYRRALIEAWAQCRDQDREEIGRMGDLEPRERLAQIMALLARPRLWKLERAMREWARSDKAVDSAVRSADRRVRRAVRQVFIDHGFDGDEADMRADTAFSVGLGQLHMPGTGARGRLKNQSAPRRDWFLEFMLRS